MCAVNNSALEAKSKAMRQRPAPRSMQRPAPRLLFLCGMADSRRETVELREDGLPVIVFMGGGGFLSDLTPGKFQTRQIWLGGIRPDNLIPRLRSRPLVNYIADVDSLSHALAQAARIVEQAGNPPCFNPPGLVARTRRDLVSENLADVPGIRVPRTVRLEPNTPEDFASAARSHRLTFPLIVRLAGDHNGISTILVDKPGQWDAIHALPWQGRAVYLTEFVDYRDVDGLYRKHRIMMVGGKPYLSHVYISDQWMAHRRTHLADKNAEEQQRLAVFDEKVLPHVKPVLDAIHRRLGLDYYGLDLHIGEDGSMILFEANAAMNYLNTGKSAQPYRAPYHARVRQAIEVRLMRYVRPARK